MIKNIFIVGLGSFAGGVLRYVLSILLSKVGKILAFPIGIFVINILITGLLGGFTTFSTFSLETLQLLQENEGLKATFYVVGSVGLGILACFLGSKIYN